MDEKNSHMSKSRLNVEKMRGKFKVCLKEDIKLKHKVTAFAQEPLSFLIHKNRKLFPKLMKQHVKN